MAIKYESPKQDAGRVTAGIPSLDSSRRFALDSKAAGQRYQDAIEGEAKNRAIASAAGDGDRPHDTNHAGLWLNGYELEKRLRALNPNLIFERSIAAPSRMGIYYKRIEFEDKHYVAGFDYERCPEFDILIIVEKQVRDRMGVPQKYRECQSRTPGWRSVLARLIKDKLITYEGAIRMFGTPTKDSKNWQIAMQ